MSLREIDLYHKMCSFKFPFAVHKIYFCYFFSLYGIYLLYGTSSQLCPFAVWNLFITQSLHILFSFRCGKFIYSTKFTLKFLISLWKIYFAKYIILFPFAVWHSFIAQNTCIHSLIYCRKCKHSFSFMLIKYFHRKKCTFY